VSGSSQTDAIGQETVRESWRAVHGQADIQYAPVKMPPPPEPPQWLKDFMKWLGDLLEPLGRLLGANGQLFLWIMLAAGVALLLFLLFRLLAPMAGWRRNAGAEAEAGWAPDESAALALLEDADALAAQGRFEEATHLLLQRSVGQIREAKPGWLDPSSTAREIAALTALPWAARQAFSVIAERVERSLFALRRLDAGDWQAARDAYADFALNYRKATPA